MREFLKRRMMTVWASIAGLIALLETNKVQILDYIGGIIDLVVEMGSKADEVGALMVALGALLGGLWQNKENAKDQ